VVFVADSQEERLDANFETQGEPARTSERAQFEFRHDPVRAAIEINVIWPNAMPVDVLKKHLAEKRRAGDEGVAITGAGVFES